MKNALDACGHSIAPQSSPTGVLSNASKKVSASIFRVETPVFAIVRGLTLRFSYDQTIDIQ